MSKLLLQAALAVLLASCAPGADLPELAAYQPQAYRLGPGDQVRVITFGEEPLTGNFRVDDRGNIALPLVGNLRAAGQTPEGLGAAVAAELRRRGLLQDPNVAVEVIAYRPVFILGEVNRPGQYPYQPGMTMLTMVAVAGGFTYRAVRDYAAIVRTLDGGAAEGRATPLAFIAPGDVIDVLERRF